jgi:hypothetical protein
MENIFEILFLSHLLTGGYINDITYLLNPKENKSLESKSYQRKTYELFQPFRFNTIIIPHL